MTAAEKLARRFHDLYEQMAPGFGYTTREETRQFIPESPNGKLMIAVCEALAASPEVKKLVADAEARGMERAQSLARRLANDSEREAERKDTTAQQRIGLNLVRDTAATLESAFRAEAAAIRRAVEGTGT